MLVVPESINVPVPVFVRPPVPLIAPENVVLALLPPVVSVADPSVTFPAPDSELTVCATLLRSSVAPLATLTADAGENAPAVPAWRVPAEIVVAPLYGALDRSEQDRAVLPARPGQRKIVLATSVAETSLTIEGVRVVVDSGLARVPKFEPDIGLTRLETVRASRASKPGKRPGKGPRPWASRHSRPRRGHPCP